MTSLATRPLIGLFGDAFHRTHTIFPRSLQFTEWKINDFDGFCTSCSYVCGEIEGVCRCHLWFLSLMYGSSFNCVYIFIFAIILWCFFLSAFMFGGWWIYVLCCVFHCLLVAIKILKIKFCSSAHPHTPMMITNNVQSHSMLICLYFPLFEPNIHLYPLFSQTHTV